MLRGLGAAWLAGLWVASSAAAADLSLTLLDSPDPVGVGGRLTYSATVSNAGLDPANAASAVVAPPPGVDVLGASATRGTCAVGRPIRCSLGTLEPGATATIGVAVRPTGPGTLTASAATAATGLGDPTPSNNQATAVTQVLVLPGTCANLREGTPLADLLVGTLGGDRMLGRAGDDRLNGQAGADCLDGEQGDDRLDGGTDADRLLGGAGADSLSGRSGSDVLIAASGNDRLHGGAEPDRLDGDGGRDRLNGGAADDRLSGGAGADSLRGGGGDDTAVGGAGADRISDAYTVVAGSGNDRVSVDGGAEVDCGPGRDLVRATDTVFAYNCERVVVRRPTSRCTQRRIRRILRCYPRGRFRTRGRRSPATVRDGGGDEPRGRRCRTRACRKCRRRKCKGGGVFARVAARPPVPALAPRRRAGANPGIARAGR